MALRANTERATQASVDDDLLELTHFSQSAADWSTSPLSRDALLERAGLSLPGSAYTLLRYLDQYSPISVSGLAALVGLHQSTVSTQLRPLVDDGLVRSTPDRDDRRVAQLSITSKGRRACERVREQGAHNWGAVLAHWSPEELHHLAELLRRVRTDVLKTVAAARARETSDRSPSESAEPLA
jgi:DNA-binding MarR family transcriptional regulator